jgi:hypothetical protein
MRSPHRECDKESTDELAKDHVHRRIDAVLRPTGDGWKPLPFTLQLGQMLAQLREEGML